MPIAANGLPLVPFGSDMWDAVSKGREDFGKPKYFKACSNHFLEGKPTKCNPDPTLFLKISTNTLATPTKPRPPPRKRCVS